MIKLLLILFAIKLYARANMLKYLSSLGLTFITSVRFKSNVN